MDEQNEACRESTPENLADIVKTFENTDTANLKIEYGANDGKLICLFTGEVDTVATSEVNKELMEKIRSAQAPVVFDFANVTYIASAFLRVNLMIAKELKDDFSIVNVSPPIKKVFKIAGFDNFISMK